MKVLVLSLFLSNLAFGGVTVQKVKFNQQSIERNTLIYVDKTEVSNKELKLYGTSMNNHGDSIEIPQAVVERAGYTLAGLHRLIFDFKRDQKREVKVIIKEKNKMQSLVIQTDR